MTEWKEGDLPLSTFQNPKILANRRNRPSEFTEGVLCAGLSRV